MDSGDPNNLAAVLGDLRFEQRLEGGMCYVHKARPTGGGHPLAIKVLKPEFSDDPTCVERMHREIEVLGELRHPGIIRLGPTHCVARGDADGVHFLELEWIEGTSLRDELDARARRGMRMTIAEICEMLGPVCHALHHAHTAARGPLVHRDVKPSNILFRGGRLSESVVTDFGIVYTPSGKKLTQTYQIVGTAEYMPPEPGKDPRSDLYSLGVVLYEMATGHVPFPDTDGNPLTVLGQHVQAKPRPPRELRADLPDWLNQLILRLLEKSLDRRPSSAAEVAQHAEKHGAVSASGRPADRAPEPGRSPSPESPRPRRARDPTALVFTLAATASLLVIAVVGGLLWLLLGQSRSSDGGEQILRNLAALRDSPVEGWYEHYDKRLDRAIESGRDLAELRRSLARAVGVHRGAERVAELAERDELERAAGRLERIAGAEGRSDYARRSVGWARSRLAMAHCERARDRLEDGRLVDARAALDRAVSVWREGPGAPPADASKRFRRSLAQTADRLIEARLEAVRGRMAAFENWSMDEWRDRAPAPIAQYLELDRLDPDELQRRTLRHVERALEQAKARIEERSRQSGSDDGSVPTVESVRKRVEAAFAHTGPGRLTPWKTALAAVEERSQNAPNSVSTAMRETTNELRGRADRIPASDSSDEDWREARSIVAGATIAAVAPRVGERPTLADARERLDAIERRIRWMREALADDGALRQVNDWVGTRPKPSTRIEELSSSLDDLRGELEAVRSLPWPAEAERIERKAGTLRERIASLSDRVSATFESLDPTRSESPVREEILARIRKRFDAKERDGGGWTLDRLWNALSKPGAVRSKYESLEARFDGLSWSWDERDRVIGTIQERVHPEVRELTEKIMAELEAEQSHEAYVRSLRETGPPNGIDAEPLAEFWREKRDALIGEYGKKDPLEDEIAALREVLRRADRALSKTLPDPRPASWDREAAEAAEAAYRDRRRAGLEKLLAAVSGAGTAEVRVDDEQWGDAKSRFTDWRGQLEALFSAYRRIEGQLAKARPIAEIDLDRIDTLRDDPIYERFRGALAPIDRRLERLRATAKESDTDDLIERGLEPDEPLAIAFGAWRRLGSLGWPEDPEALREERRLFEHLGDRLDRSGLESDARKARKRELAKGVRQRWWRALAQAAPEERREILSPARLQPWAENPGLTPLPGEATKSAVTAFLAEAPLTQARDAVVGARLGYAGELSSWPSGLAQWKRELAIRDAMTPADRDRLELTREAAWRRAFEGAPRSEAKPLLEALSRLGESDDAGSLLEKVRRQREKVQRPAAAFNLYRYELKTRLDAFSGEDADLESVAERLHTRIKGDDRLSVRGATRGFVDAFGQALEGSAAVTAETLAKAGPGSLSGWDLAGDASGEGVAVYRGWGHELRFIRVGGESPVYWCATEAPVWLAIKASSNNMVLPSDNGGEGQSVLDVLSSSKTVEENRPGLVVWFSAGGKIQPAGQFWRPSPMWREPGMDRYPWEDDLNGGALGPDDAEASLRVGRPSDRHPLQWIEPRAAARLARGLGCRLPTARRWRRVARALSPEEPNLRGEEWRTMVSPWPRRFPWWNRLAARSYAKAVSPGNPRGSPEANAVAGRDGTVALAEVGEGGKTNGRPVASGIHHLFGNAAEWVRSRQDGFAVAGGSALSGARGSGEITAVESLGSSPWYYTDVGFRLAFDAPRDRSNDDESEPLKVRLRSVLDDHPYLGAKGGGAGSG